MRIGISTLMIQRGKTGVAQYLFALVRALQKQSSPHQFTLFVLEEDIPLFKFVDGTTNIVGVPERYRPPVKNILWHQQQLPGLAHKFELQLLHIPSYRRLLARRPCPLVATIHDLAPFHVPKKYDWKRMFYGRVVVRWLARRQDRIIAVSHNTAADITKFFGLPERRIEVVHNGLEHDRFYPGSTDGAKQWVAAKFDLQGPFFLYLARLEHPGKNHLRLITAFDRFKTTTHSRWKLVLGGSDWHGADTIHAAIAASPQRQHIRSLGFVPDANLPELYRAADAFVYPSLYEGFGFPPLEAMACGCPVISSTRGSLGEVIGDAALTVDAADVESIAKQLSRLALDESLRNQLRAAGIEQAGTFNWDRTASETLRVYEQTANRLPSRPAVIKVRTDSLPA
jgi:glycosyltransferase involved in cell wall biosynthesis